MFKKFRQKSKVEKHKDISGSRRISLAGEITDETASQTIAYLLFLQSENSKESITIDINSPGGSVTASLAIIDTLRIISCPVCTHCVGMASGTALNILAAGKKGLRSTKSGATLSFTKIFSRDEKVTQVSIDEINRLKEILVAQFKRDTFLSNENIRKAFDQSRAFSTEEAIAYGLVDDVV